MKLKMTVEEALEFADEWSRGLTLYEGAQGWRVVCMLLAEEVRRLRNTDREASVIAEREACAEVCRDLAESHKRGTGGECDNDCDFVVAWETAERLIRERSEVSGAPHGECGAEIHRLEAENGELLDLLASLFEAYEYGPKCYEDPEDRSGFLGYAVLLDDGTLKRVAAVLNRHEEQER